MSSHKKIYNIEITPPAGAWNNIANTLDEAGSFKALTTKINDIEVTPPVNVWNNILHTLQQEPEQQKFAEKLYTLEIAAPEMVWDKIAFELDDQHALDIIEKKLQNIEVAPPTKVWMNIKKDLEGKKKQPATLLPMHHGWLKYAAAACFIAIISITAYFILSDGSSAPTSLANSGKGEKDIKTVVSNTTISAHSSSSNARQQTLAGIRTRLGNAYTASSEKNTELQNRYIILMTQDGNIVRISKKVGSMADCIAGEDNSCDDQISKWQKEMASSATAAGPDHFLDILEIASDEPQEANKPNM